MKILLIEDEIDLQESIVEFLEDEGYLVETASDFFGAEEKVELYSYNCIIVDISLPGGSGLDIIRKLKIDNKQTGIIIISARNSIEDKLTGFDIGADDYLTKPFYLSELNARVKSIIRRRELNRAEELVYNEIKIIFETRAVQVKEQDILLTRKEYDLLLYFIMNKERVLSKDVIAEHLWGDDMGITADSFDFIYTHIKNLRKKLIDKGSNDYIQTVYGIGYKFSDR